MNRITESESLYNSLEKMSSLELLTNINQEDSKVATAIQQAIPAIHALVENIVPKMQQGGRLFYIGAGTSGRLGIVDASECPPTFGVDFNTVIGIIAGGDSAIRKAVEFAEDSTTQGWEDLQSHGITTMDTVIGIAASGTTPYVIAALRSCQKNSITTGCITCNPDAPINEVSDYPISVVVGPEFITGSTRMKAGTAQKLVLNMISSTVMIKLGKVKGNRMVDMVPSNAKLVQRGSSMIAEALSIPLTEANELLKIHGSVRAAIQNYATK